MIAYTNNPVYADCDTAEAQDAHENLLQAAVFTGWLHESLADVGDERLVVPVAHACDALVSVLRADLDPSDLGSAAASIAVRPAPTDPDQTIRRCWWMSQQVFNRCAYARAERAYPLMNAVWTAVAELAYARRLHERSPDRCPPELTEPFDQAAWHFVAGCRQSALERAYAEGVSEERP